MEDSSSSESVEGPCDTEAANPDTIVKKEEDADEPEHITSSSWRTGPAGNKYKKFTEEEGEPWLPKRVSQALSESKTFAEFKEKRKFIYVHLFSGPQDVLGQAITKMANLDGMQVEVRAFDKEAPEHRVDLAAEQPFHDNLDAARGGLVDGSHAVFPAVPSAEPDTMKDTDHHLSDP